jgi:hypothetical protein
MGGSSPGLGCPAEEAERVSTPAISNTSKASGK